jgi:hypothetical protein
VPENKSAVAGAVNISLTKSSREACVMYGIRFPLVVFVVAYLVVLGHSSNSPLPLEALGNGSNSSLPEVTLGSSSICSLPMGFASCYDSQLLPSARMSRVIATTVA